MLLRCLMKGGINIKIIWQGVIRLNVLTLIHPNNFPSFWRKRRAIGVEKKFGFAQKV